MLRAALPKLTRNPCGDLRTCAKVAPKVDLAYVHRIHVPVLVVAGGADALYPPPTGRRQAALFTGSRSVGLVTLPRTAHALTLERTHRALAAVIGTWLRRVVQ